MQKLRVGLVGAGPVGPAEHAFCFGLHVPCEKPLALTVAGCNGIELPTMAFRRAIT
jgi:predicted dehydrogenase